MLLEADAGSITVRFHFDMEKDLIVPNDPADQVIEVPVYISAINLILDKNPSDPLNTVLTTFPIQWVDRKGSNLLPIEPPLTFVTNRINDHVAVIADFHFDADVPHHFILIGLRGDRAVSSLDPTIVNQAPPSALVDSH